jgi:RNase P subunit RPR2
MCGKLCFPSEREAQAYVNQRRKRGFGRNAQRRGKIRLPASIRCYYCDECQSWHFTRQGWDKKRGA